MNSQKVNAEGEIKIPGVTEVLLLPRKVRHSTNNKFDIFNISGSNMYQRKNIYIKYSNCIYSYL